MDADPVTPYATRANSRSRDGEVESSTVDLSPDMAQTVATLQTLADVIRAGFAVVDVVIQDEFTHDVVVRQAALGAVHLVFDTT